MSEEDDDLDFMNHFKKIRDRLKTGSTPKIINDIELNMEEYDTINDDEWSFNITIEDEEKAYNILKTNYIDLFFEYDLIKDINELLILNDEYELVIFHKKYFNYRKCLFYQCQDNILTIQSLKKTNQIQIPLSHYFIFYRKNIKRNLFRKQLESLLKSTSIKVRLKKNNTNQPSNEPDLLEKIDEDESQDIFEKIIE